MKMMENDHINLFKSDDDDTDFFENEVNYILYMLFGATKSIQYLKYLGFKFMCFEEHC